MQNSLVEENAQNVDTFLKIHALDWMSRICCRIIQAQKAVASHESQFIGTPETLVNSQKCVIEWLQNRAGEDDIRAELCSRTRGGLSHPAVFYLMHWLHLACQSAISAAEGLETIDEEARQKLEVVQSLMQDYAQMIYPKEK